MKAVTPGRAANGAAEAALTETAPGRFALEGELGFATARRLYERGQDVILGAGPALEFDCRGLRHTDSAGVAVLIHWLALAKGRGRSLRYAGLSEAVRSIARLSEVEALLESGV